jgi:hypothetical protein
MPLLDHLCRRLNRVGHAQACHNHRQSPPREGGNGELVFDIAELSSAASSGAQYAEVEELLEHQIFMLSPEGVRRV